MRVFCHCFVAGLRRLRRAAEGERRGRIFLQDRKIVRGDCQPAKFEHVSARCGYSSDLCPGDLIDQVTFSFTCGNFRDFNLAAVLPKALAGFSVVPRACSPGQILSYRPRLFACEPRRHAP